MSKHPEHYGASRETWHILYRDDGPEGACGQSCRTTMPWSQLYLFTGTHGECKAKAETLVGRGRKNPTVELFAPSAFVAEWFGYGEVKHLY